MILEDHGHYNLGYLSQLSYNAAAVYNHDKRASYIDEYCDLQPGLQALTGVPGRGDLQQYRQPQP